MNRKILRGVFGVALVLGLVFGQETRVLAGSTGQITGKVTDSITGAAIAGATITASSPSGTYHTTTDPRGNFAVVNVYPDTYRVTALASGYQTALSEGNSVVQNNSAVVNFSLSRVATVLGHVTVHGVTTVVQPNVTADQYVLTAAAANSTNGSGGSMSLYQTPGVIGTLPGVTLDAGGTAHIRGGRLEEVGYEYDGLTTVEPVTGTFATNLVEDGISRIQVSTGGYDASGGNSISGVVNTVVGVGTYPAHGSITTLMQGPTFYHGLNFDYGSATPNGRFSWYAAAVTWNSGYDWGNRNTFYPGPESAETGSIAFLGAVAPSRDEVLNMHYRFGPNNDNDIQYLGTTGVEHYNNMIQALYYPSMNPGNGPVATSPTAVGGICNNGIGLFPGQLSCTQAAPAGMTDHDDQGYFIDKLGWTHNFGSSSALSMHYARVDSYVTFSFPFGDGSFDDLWQNRHSDQQELFAEYTSQLNAQNLIKVGGQSIYSTNNLTIAVPSGGFGEVEPANNRDGAYWLSDEFKPTNKLNLNISGRRDTRTYYRVAAPTFSDGVNQLRGSFAYTLTPGTVIRGSDGNFAELPADSRVELFLTGYPNFFDYSPSNRLAILREAQPDVPQSHLSDFSLEHDFGNGMAIKAGPFYRKSDNLVLTFRNPGQPGALPTAVGPYFVNGFEGEWQFNNTGSGLSGFINYTHTRAQAVVPGDFNQSVPVGPKYAGALFPVSFVPPNAGNLVLNFRHGRWLINPVINYIGGYPYGVGRNTFNDYGCPASSNKSGLSTAPCGAIIGNPAAYSNPGTDPVTLGPACVPGTCTALLDPNESAFADGRVCCTMLIANLNLYYDLNSRTNVGVQIQNLNRDYRPTFLESNPFNGNPFVNYGTSPYIPGQVSGSQEFILTITQKI